VPESNIVELDWWERHVIGDLEIVATKMDGTILP